MADIYRTQELQFGGSYEADSAMVNFVGAGICNGLPNDLAAGAGMLAQQLGIQYVQPVQRFYELGSQNVYYFAGRPQGQGSIARLLGPRLIAELFYAVLGNVCCADGNNVTVSAATGCANGNPGENGMITWTLKGVLLTSLGSQIASEDMIWREQLTFLFYCLKSGNINATVDDGGGTWGMEGGGGTWGGGEPLAELEDMGGGGGSWGGEPLAELEEASDGGDLEPATFTIEPAVPGLG